MKKRILSLVLTICMLMITCVQPTIIYANDNFKFTLNGDTLTISGNGSLKYIPSDMYDEFASLKYKAKELVFEDGITEIGEIFTNQTSLEKVTLPKTLKSLGIYTFRGCTNLKEVEFPDTEFEILGGTFERCTNLKEVYIPASVTLSGYLPFGYSNYDGTGKLDLTIYTPENSSAYQYAKNNGINVVVSTRVEFEQKNGSLPSERTLTEVNVPIGVDATPKTETVHATIRINDTEGSVLSANGDLWVWGSNYDGKLAAGETSKITKPTKIMENVKEYSIGSHSVFLKNDGSLWACGSNLNGGLGMPYRECQKTSTPMCIMNHIISLVCSNAVIDVDGNLWVWGNNDFSTQVEPKIIASNVEDAVNVYGALLITKTDKSLWGYGSNRYGQLGTTEIGHYSGNKNEPIKIMDGVEKISYYNASIAVIRNDKSLWTWGDNDYGQLGIGKKDKADDCMVPIKVLEDVIDVSMGEEYCSAIKSNGDVWGWGCNIYNQLTTDSTDDYVLTPQKTSISGAKKVYTIDEIFNALCVIKNDNSMWITGPNRHNRYSHITEGDMVVPIRVMEDVKEVYELDTFLFALKNDGTLWLWGSSEYYGLPWTYTKIMDDVCMADCCDKNFIALKNDGTVWTWGKNSTFFSLGTSSTESVKEPIRILDAIQLYDEIIPLEKPITVLLNDNKIDFDVPPVIEEGRTLVPLRAIFEAMGMTVDWDGTTSTITATGGGNSISMRVNETAATVNGKTLTMDVPSKVIEGRTLVPVRFIAESIGANVDWNETEKRVNITYNPHKSVPLILTDDNYIWLHTYINPNLQEYMWDYNEANIFGSQENAEKIMNRIGFGALTIVGATKFYDLFVGWDYSVVTDADKDVYDSLIKKMITVDESILESSTQKSIESFLEAGGDLKQMKKIFGNIEKIYKDVYNDKDGFGIQLLNETFDKGLEYILVDNLSDAVIDALSKYLTIASLYDAYAVTGDSALQLLNCMEADGYEKEFVAYAKEKLKCYEDIDSLVKEACKEGAESSLRSLIKKTLQNVGKKGVETIGRKLNISKEMKEVFNASSWQSICAKMIYGFIESSPTVKAADNYVVLLGMRTLNIYSKYYFNLTVEEAKRTNNFYTVEQQNKIKNLALANLNTTIKCRELLISLLEVMRDEGWKEYIERLNKTNELAHAFMSQWCSCDIMY